jgi:hypothetical protein
VAPFPKVHSIRQTHPDINHEANSPETKGQAEKIEKANRLGKRCTI